MHHGCFPLTFSRQHLGFDGCLEDKTENIRTVLCCIVYQSYAHRHQQFLQVH